MSPDHSRCLTTSITLDSTQSRLRDRDAALACYEVVAIVVLFHPDPVAVLQTLQQLLNQVDRVLIFCNSPLPDTLVPIAERPNVIVMGSSENIGLAAAQNLALQQARRDGARYVLLLDQDSSPPADLVPQLITMYCSLAARGISVAALGPLLIDEGNDAAWPFETVSSNDSLAGDPVLTAGLIEVDFLRASGSLIPLDVIDRIGGFIDYLFIDHIDLEWCLRARAHGFRSFGVKQLRMRHRIGDGSVRFLGRLHPVHSGQRDYYVFRNSMVLLRLAHIPWRWKINEVVRILPRAVFYAWQHEQVAQHLMWCLRGIKDGLLSDGRQLVPFRSHID